MTWKFWLDCNQWAVGQKCIARRLAVCIMQIWGEMKYNSNVKIQTTAWLAAALRIAIGPQHISEHLATVIKTKCINLRDDNISFLW